MAATYPKRPSHFAHKFTRLLLKACVANELGAEAALLLIAVAHTEDAKGYRGPVTFHNGQFLPLIGVGSEAAFKRLRSKCEDAGWLVHQDGSRSKTPAYWVTIPAEYCGWDDGPTDETPTDYIGTTGANGSAGDPQCDLNAISIRSQCDLNADPKRSPSDRNAISKRTAFFPSPSPDPSPSPNAPLPPAEPGGGAVEPPTPDLKPTDDPEPEPVAAFGELVREWTAAQLPGHDSPGGIQRTSNRVGHWQTRLRDPTWAARWRDAVRRAGCSARCRGTDPKWPQGLRLDTFLKDPDVLVRLLEGEFDAKAPGAAPGGGKPTISDVIAEERRKRNSGDAR